MLILTLAACQPQPAIATPSAVPNIPITAATSTASKILSAPATIIVMTAPAQPVVHSSGTDPNATNLIAVRDQPLANGSITVDFVRAAQPGWLALYLAKNDKPGHHLGYIAIPSGESQQVTIPLDPHAGIAITEDMLGGKQIFVVLQAGAKAPGLPVEVTGHSVLVAFTVLPGGNP